MEFYRKLGFPLIKVFKAEHHGGYYHFFFDIGNGNCLAYFWYANSPAAHPGISTINPANMDKSTATAHGSMNHVGFDVDSLDNLFTIRKSLKSKGLKPTAVFMHHKDGVALKFDKQETMWASFYLFGPDGEWLEFTFQNIDLSPSNLHKNIGVDVQRFLDSKL
eukprot:CAMPEP_0197032218 /NCGR_PEP_ID=MMETSP1384-20130603/10950_1 /TAXON_ID=29189 /ORGANISM="Ammonia sp." /LENGTH=162 /DNA_ID=CAMNT_0042461845 /DNA_START=103 /DNA_END=591 /DNA_ORIENTATION=-